MYGGMSACDNTPALSRQNHRRISSGHLPHLLGDGGRRATSFLTLPRLPTLFAPAPLSHHAFSVATAIHYLARNSGEATYTERAGMARACAWP